VTAGRSATRVLTIASLSTQFTPDRLL